jgi:DNA-binding transcriptional MerR regulator
MMSQPRDEFTPNEEPLFNIGAVSRMTDISETTLRVWERRYDFPNSTRSAGGHRLYSKQDVARLQWVKLRIDEGMQTGQAIRALQHTEREGGSMPVPLSAQPFAAGEGHRDALGKYHERLLDALLLHDAELSNQILAEALVLFPLEYLLLNVIIPTFYDIGEAWSAGRIDVATEHFATNHLRHHLLVWMRIGPPAYHVNPVVLACAPGELHEGSLLILAVLLRRLRWPIIYLGQTMPLSDMANFIDEVEASVIVFVAMTQETAHALAEWPHWMPNAARTKHPLITYGGRVFSEQPALAEHMPGLLLGETIQEGVETLDRILHDLNPLLR